MIRAAVGDKTDFRPQKRPMSVATKLLALRPGVVKELPNFDKIASEKSVIIEHHLHVGDLINEYHTNLDGCGYVVAKSFDIGDALAKATEVKNIIDTSIIRK